MQLWSALDSCKQFPQCRSASNSYRLWNLLCCPSFVQSETLDFFVSSFDFNSTWLEKIFQNCRLSWLLKACSYSWAARQATMAEDCSHCVIYKFSYWMLAAGCCVKNCMWVQKIIQPYCRSHSLYLMTYICPEHMWQSSWEICIKSHIWHDTRPLGVLMEQVYLTWHPAK